MQRICLLFQESMLNKLQSSVETEEKKWQEKLTETEKELHAVSTCTSLEFIASVPLIA
jgi:hypothetical protein